MVTEGLGTDVPGTGDAGNPYVVHVDGSEIAGDGIGWQGNAFTVRIEPGGGLEFNPSGALRTTGVGPPDQGRADVKHLEDRTQDVFGGSIGAGFLIKPPDLLSSFQYGMQQGLDFLHVPVRFLQDGSPVIRMSETMERSSRNPADHVQEMDPHVWAITNTKPGMDYFHRLAEDFWLPSQPPLNAPRTGWYGYLEHGQLGLTYLSDVMREVGGKIVLLLDLRFPHRNEAGEMQAPPWRLDLFLAQVKAMILHFGLTNSVIVTSTEIDIPTGLPPGPTRKVLDFFSEAGIRVGPYLESEAAADLYPPNADPDVWPSNWTWVFLSRSIPRAKLQAYVDRVAEPVLHTILFVVTRQHLRTSLVNKPAGIGAKGVISADPEYYAAFVPPFSGRYRGYAQTPYLANATVKHGLLPAGTESLNTMSWQQRGAGRIGYRGIWLGRDTPRDPLAGTAFVNQGYMCPHPSSTTVGVDPLDVSQGIDMAVGFDQLPASGTGWTAVAFGVTTDHGFKDRALQQPPDPNYNLDSGYVLLVDTTGAFYLLGYDQGVGTDLNTTGVVPVPYGPPKPIGHSQNPDRNRGAPIFFRIGVNRNGIKISQITQFHDPNTGPLIIESKTDLAKAHRGGYISFGRYSQQDVEWLCWFDVTFLPNANPPIGPSA